MKRTYKLFLLYLLLISVCTPIGVAAEPKAKEIRLECKNERLPSVFKRLEKMSGYKILFTYDDVNQFFMTGQINTKDIQQALKIIIGSKPLEYQIDDQYINIILKERSKKIESTHKVDNKKAPYIVLQGFVFDSEQKGLPGVNISVKGIPTSISGTDGSFSLSLKRDNSMKVSFSYIGMKTEVREFNLDEDQRNVIISLQEDKTEIKEVVVNGMFTRRAESFTGSATTYKKNDLLQAGNQNLLKSLKNIDPSFQMFESLDFGSDPNHMPQIQMRGQTSFPNLKGDYSGNPNLPLFILDGFEATLEKVYDLDMNRVSSVTLLKDAAAKAVYGSKAANGVVVIETVRPKSGKLMISYNSNLDIEAPDLTGYNLMNASEKLAFEKERGMYTKYTSSPTDVTTFDTQYKDRYDNIQRGVNTYWLSKPLRTGIGQKHSFSLEGGDTQMRYLASFFYNNVAGVMKGSNRNTLGISTTLSYTYKNLIFRNSLEYTNNLSTNSPYGSFSDYAALNQYFSPYDNSGNIEKVLGYYSTANTPIYNPLYNATLNTKSESNYMDIRNNFSLEWRISEAFRATGRLSYTKQSNGTDLFYPSSHTMFASYDANGLSDRKGQYTKGVGSDQYVTADAGLNFNKTFGKHLIFANTTWNLSSKRSTSNSFIAEGFGNDYMNDISSATQYLKESKPSGSDSRVREIGIVSALNYSFDDRYLFDASTRTTGSSMYGSNNRWGLFWSLGAGWNLHHEKFLKSNTWIKQLKLRSSLGYTGSESFNPYQGRAVYEYGDVVYDTQLGASLVALPNNSLRWQRTQDFNSGVDLMLKRFLIARFDYYISTTSDLLSDISTPSSMGFSSYKENLGKIQNRGLEFNLAVTPWRNDTKRAWVTVSLSTIHNENKIKQIYDIFKNYNDSQNTNKDASSTTNATTLDQIKALLEQYTRPSTLYYEGQSMTAIWGVRSLGIDPMTGKEMYLDKKGNRTFIWSSADQVVIGDTQAKLRGTIGVSGGYEGFTLSLLCSYKWGGDLYNTTLVDKVENVSGYDNLDRRILDSWRKVGDISPYKALEISAGTNTTNYTKPTSRFVQSDNELYLSSVNVGYDFNKLKLISKIGLENLKLSFYMNELLRLSSVTIERGTSYPFSRNFSFSLQATF